MTPILYHLTLTVWQLALIKAAFTLAVGGFVGSICAGAGSDRAVRREREERDVDDAAMPWLRHA